MNTVHPKIIAAALAIAPRNDVRPQLNGVRLHADESGHLVVVGTDGSALLCIRTAIRWNLDPMTIPYDVAKVLAAAKRPINFSASVAGSDVTADADGALRTFDPVDLPYPDYAVLIRDPRTDGPRNAIAPVLIERFAKAAKELTKVAGKCGVDVTEARDGCAAQWRVIPYTVGPVFLGAAFVVASLRKDCTAEGLSFTALADGL